MNSDYYYDLQESWEKWTEDPEVQRIANELSNKYKIINLVKEGNIVKF